MSPLLPKRHFLRFLLRLLLDLHKITQSSLHRCSIYSLGLLRRLYHAFTEQTSQSRQHPPPVLPSYSDDSHYVIEMACLDSPETRAHSMSIPIDPSYLSASPSQPTNGLLQPAQIPSTPPPLTPVPFSDHLSVLSESDKPTHLRDVNNMFVPISPEILGRYDRREIVADQSKEMIINSLTFEFDNRQLPEGWERSISPEGTNLFYNTAKHIWTDANIFSDKYFAPLSQFIQEYEGFMKSRNIVLTSGMEMITDVAIFPETGEWMCSYYFVDHRFKTVFWLDKFDPYESVLWGEILGVTTESHLGIWIEKLYWEHAMMFPKSRDKYAVEDLMICRGLLLQAWSDTMTSLTSTFPFSSVECETYLRMMDQVEKEISLSVSNGSTPMDNISFSISRLMNDFTKSRFMNFYGEPSARLNRDQSVYSAGPCTHTWLVTLMRPILFRAPDTYLKMFEPIVVDCIYHLNSWKVALEAIGYEWQQVTLLGTVTLTANVSFLDLDTVSGPSGQTITVVSYLSTMTSIGSIMVGLLLIRTKSLGFLQPGGFRVLNLETLAILFSIPFALLMWSMVLFLFSFTLMCSVNTPRLVNIPIFVVLWMVLVSILWAMYMTRDRNNGHRLSLSAFLTQRLLTDVNNKQQQQNAYGPSSSVSNRSKKPAHRRVWGSLAMNIKSIFQKPSIESGTAV